MTNAANKITAPEGIEPVRTLLVTSLRAGVNPKIVSARLGHATVAFTLDTYTEDVPELHHTAAETVSRLFLDPPSDEDQVPSLDEP
jgi:integrase